MLVEPTKRKRYAPEVRKAEILKSATLLAEEKGYKNFSSLDLAEHCGLAGHSLIFHHFKNMDAIRDEVMVRAIAEENLVILAQGMAGQDPIANGADERLRRKALSALKN
jgi:AcrR family transcriptional regulator